ncbi:MAG: hypothetical protein LQ351_003426 [Letrouitia transgressa]|nr:MAG: hypothetical protein LQ351_003426 [Letrouitia transgressa]
MVHVLSGTYTTPTESREFSHKFTSISTGSSSPSSASPNGHPPSASTQTSRPTPTATKVHHLFNLRSAVSQLQDDINAFLTQQMEADARSSKQEGAVKDGRGENRVDDTRAAERYGEEGQEVEEEEHNG